jgi:hypothetical protein
MSQNVAQNIPSTQEAVGGLHQAQKFLDERSQKGGAGAQRTIADINQALQDAKTLVQDKDLGDSVSKLVNDTAAVGEQAKQNAQAAKQQLRAEGGSINTAGLSQEELERLSRDAHEAANQLRRAAQLTVTSPSFRNFLWEWYQLVRDTWAPQLDRALEQRLKEGRKDDLTQQGEWKAKELRDQAWQASNRATAEAQGKKEELSRAAQDVRQAAARGDAKSAVAGARDTAADLSREAWQRVDEQFPPERREELVQRWQSLKRQLQEDPNLRAAIDDLKGALTRLRQDAQPVLDKASQGVQQVKEAAKDKSQDWKQSAQQADTTGLWQVAWDARELIEKFANGWSLQKLIDAFQAWTRALDQDQELRQWISDVWSWANQTKQDANKLNDDQHLQQLNSFVDRGRSIAQGRHKQILENLLSEAQEFIWALRNDASSNRLRQSLSNVVEDLFVDKTGKVVLKPDLYNQLGKALAPSFRDLFRDIRIAHIEEHNDKADFALDNVNIDASDIQPNQLDVTSIADVSIGKQDTSADLRFRISAKGITPKVRNAYFRYEKHTFPKLSDFGSLDAALTGDGLSFTVDVESWINAKDNYEKRTFRVRDVTVNLRGLKLDFHHAQHETLYKIFKPLIISRLTRQIERTIRDQLYYYVEELDNTVTDARRRASQAVVQAAGDRIVGGVDNNVGHSRWRRAEFREGAQYQSWVAYPRDVQTA